MTGPPRTAVLTAPRRTSDDDPEDQTARRASRIRRLWQHASSNPRRRALWENWKWEDSSFVVGMVATCSNLLLEPLLWYPFWTSPFGLGASDRVALALLLLAPLNGLLLVPLLASRATWQRTVPLRFRVLYFAVASLPLLGLYALPVWRLMQKGKPRSALGSRSATLSIRDPTGSFRPPDSASRRVATRSQAVLMAWIGGALLPPMVWASWLGTTCNAVPGRRTAALAACILVHLIAFATLTQYLARRQEHFSPGGVASRLRRHLPLLWLLPLPGPILGVLGMGLLDSTQGTLTGSAYDRRSSMRNLPLWFGLERTLRATWRKEPWWRLWRGPLGLVFSSKAGDVEQHLLSFYRLKAFLTVFEACALTWGLDRIVGALRPDWTDSANGLLRAVVWAACGLAIAGGSIQLFVLAARALRAAERIGSLARGLFASYLLLTESALVAGIEMAFLALGRADPRAWLLLSSIAALCAMLSAGIFLPWPSKSRDLRDFLWSLLFLALAALGGLRALAGQLPAPLHGHAALVMASVPVASVSLGLTLGRWLLRPFRLRDLFSQRLPRNTRLVLAGLALTAALPLGGLAIPLWIQVRPRLWPRYERQGLGLAR